MFWSLKKSPPKRCTILLTVNLSIGRNYKAWLTVTLYLKTVQRRITAGRRPAARAGSSKSLRGSTGEGRRCITHRTSGGVQRVGVPRCLAFTRISLWRLCASDEGIPCACSLHLHTAWGSLPGQYVIVIITISDIRTLPTEHCPPLQSSDAIDYTPLVYKGQNVYV